MLCRNRRTPIPYQDAAGVFCKSDCTHASNKGTPTANVASGLCKMMAGKIMELLKNISSRHIMIVGGVATSVCGVISIGPFAVFPAVFRKRYCMKPRTARSKPHPSPETLCCNKRCPFLTTCRFCLSKATDRLFCRSYKPNWRHFVCAPND